MTKELKTQLIEHRADLIDRFETQLYRQDISALECALGEAGYQERRAARESISDSPRVMTPEYYANEAGWGDQLFGMTADPTDRYEGSNKPVFQSEADLRKIRAIGRFYTEFDEVGLGTRDNVANYVGGEAINYVVESREKDKHTDVVDAVQEWVDLFLEENKWCGLREKTPMREAFSDGEVLLPIGLDPDREYPEIRIVDCAHLTDPQNLAQAQTSRLGFDWLNWSYGIGTPVGRQDRPKGYFLDWYGQGDYQLFPEATVVHVKLNSHEDVKRGINDLFVAHTNLKRAAKGLGATAQQAAIQATIAWIETVAESTPMEAVQRGISTPGTVSRTIVDALGVSRSINSEAYMGGKIVRTNGTKYSYGPVGTPAGAKLVEVFAAVLRRVAVRWQMPEWMVSGDASNNNMASSVVAETPFHRSMRTRQGEWADKYEEVIWKALNLAIAVGRGPEGIPNDVRLLRRMIHLRAKCPDPKERDQLEETTICEIEHRNRVLSVKTWQEMRGYDAETEEQNFAEEDEANLARTEAEFMATGGAEDPNAPGADPTVPNRAQVIKKKADRKARASEAVSPEAVKEFAKGDIPIETRRELAAAILYDGAEPA